MSKISVIIILVLYVLQADLALADEPKTGAKQSKPVVASDSGKKKENSPKSTPQPSVSEAHRVLPENGTGNPEIAGLGDTIRVKVENLAQFMENNKKDGKEKNIHLFLNRMEIKGIQPESVNEKTGELQFHLLRREALFPAYLGDSQQRSVWAALFGFRDQWRLTRVVNVSVGPEDGQALASEAKLTLIRIRTSWVLFYFIVIAALGWTYKWAHKKGAFLDRGGLEDDQASSKDNEKCALSLARVQMGWWFFLVVAAFFFIWMVIGELPAIPPSVLGLIGIASGTALGAAAIDASKRAKANADVQDWKNQKTLLATQMEALVKKIELKEQQRVTLNSEIIELKKSPPQNQAVIDKKNQELLAIEKEIEVLTTERQGMKARLDKLASDIDNAQSRKQAVRASGSRIYDLLSDADGVSFHRLQMAIWTVVLGIVFAEQVMSNLALPEFDTTLLALMGISSGTYLGFKFPEQQPKTQGS